MILIWIIVKNQFITFLKSDNFSVKLGWWPSISHAATLTQINKFAIAMCIRLRNSTIIIHYVSIFGTWPLLELYWAVYTRTALTSITTRVEHLQISWLWSLLFLSWQFRWIFHYSMIILARYYSNRWLLPRRIVASSTHFCHVSVADAPVFVLWCVLNRFCYLKWPLIRHRCHLFTHTCRHAIIWPLLQLAFPSWALWLSVITDDFRAYGCWPCPMQRIHGVLIIFANNIINNVFVVLKCSLRIPLSTHRTHRFSLEIDATTFYYFFRLKIEQLLLRTFMFRLDWIIRSIKLHYDAGTIFLRRLKSHRSLRNLHSLHICNWNCIWRLLNSCLAIVVGVVFV